METPDESLEKLANDTAGPAAKNVLTSDAVMRTVENVAETKSTDLKRGARDIVAPLYLRVILGV